MLHKLLLVAEEGADPLRLILPTELDELIFGALAFFILFAFISKMAIPRFRSAMQAREDAIRGELEKAEQARLASEKAKDDYEKQIADARGEADRIVREATEAAEAARRERIERAEDEARGIVEKARSEAGQERDRAFAELQRTVADLSLDAAARVVEQELSDPAAQRQLVERFIEQAGANN